MELPEPPKKFSKRALYAWLNKVREVVQTYRAIEGRNVHISGGDNGQPQIIDADDCTPCP